MRVLITGVSGFVGTHLSRHLRQAGHSLYGLTRSSPPAEPTADLAQLFHADIGDLASLTEVVKGVQPDGVVHLAAQSSIGASFTDIAETQRVNFTGSLHLFAAVQQAAPRSRIVWVGSADAYGAVNADQLPVDESTPLRPVSPYGVSKAAADLAAYQWVTSHDLDIVRVRPFNSTGPGQAPRFICADFASQVVIAERAGETPIIRAGALDVVRDFVDVRDLAAAIAVVLFTGTRGEAYNVCSGVGRTPRQVAHSLLQLSGHGGNVAACDQRLRPAEIPILVGNAAKISAATGWRPQIAWEQTLSDVLADWRARLLDQQPRE